MVTLRSEPRYGLLSRSAPLLLFAPVGGERERFDGALFRDEDGGGKREFEPDWFEPLRPGGPGRRAGGDPRLRYGGGVRSFFISRWSRSLKNIIKISHNSGIIMWY